MMEADDPFGRPATKAATNVVTHVVGERLDALSVAELDERVALLEAEIARLRDARQAKDASRRAAAAAFKNG